MSRFFRKLPFVIKLVLIGVVPFAFLIYLTIEVYSQKNQRLDVLSRYIERVHESSTLSALIDALEEERKISFDYVLHKAQYNDVATIRPVADSLFEAVEKSKDPSVQGFKMYTYIDRLMQTRNQIDNNKADPNAIMHNYSNSIFRLNTLNTVPNAIMLEPVYKDMVSQKLLTEMRTYLGIIRSNIYNVLLTRKYMVETLLGTLGTYDVYKSYDQEFLLKASPKALKAFQQAKESSDLNTTNHYIDTVFKRFQFDNSLTADQWWTVSNAAISKLSVIEETIWDRIEARLHSIYQTELRSRNTTLLIFVLILNVLVVLIVVTFAVMTKMLNDLKLAARKIAKGATNVSVKQESNDVIGALAGCIDEIAKSNLKLAQAAEAIGNGNFGVNVTPRSSEDDLANSIIRMKEALFQYSQRMEGLVQQRTEALENSNNDLQRFAHVVSHDLKEPLRKISMYSDRLLAENTNRESTGKAGYLEKIMQSTARMSKMIDDILAYYSIHAGNGQFETVDLKAMIENVKADHELLIEQKKATITVGTIPEIEAVPVLMNQLFHNLINNSLKFSRQDVQPQIHIDSRRMEGKACNSGGYCYEITIKDNGIGIEEEFSEKIFGIFNRLHTQSKFEGTGLGLALCKRIVEYHHGKIWVESNGEGSVFKIILPQKQNAEALVSS